MPETPLIFVNARFLTQPLTGVQRYAFECSVQMKKMNPSIQFVCPSNICQHEWALELEATKIGNNKGVLWEQLDLWLFMRKQTNAVLINLCNTAPIFISNQVITIHDISFKRFPENNSFLFQTWYNFLIPRIVKICNHIFTVSHTVKEELKKVYQLNDAKISITYNGIPRSFMHESESKKEKIILTVGSISKRKNTSLIVEAFLQSDLMQEYKLIIIGNISSIFSEQTIPSHSNIVCLEGVSDQELIEYYKKAEIFVSMSEYEGFGIPILEALYFNCKVLSSNIQTYQELFGEYVYFCDNMTSTYIAESLQHLKQHQSPSIDKTKLMHRFSFEQSAEHILSIAEKNIHS